MTLQVDPLIMIALTNCTLFGERIQCKHLHVLMSTHRSILWTSTSSCLLLQFERSYKQIRSSKTNIGAHRNHVGFVIQIISNELIHFRVYRAVILLFKHGVDIVRLRRRLCDLDQWHFPFCKHYYNLHNGYEFYPLVDYFQVYTNL